MAEPLLIQPLDLADFADPGPGAAGGFLDLVSSELGDAATASDGFDAVVEEMQGFVDALDAGLALLAGADGGDLDEAFAEVLALDPEPVRSNAADFAAALPAGDQAVTDLGNLLTGTAPTPPAGGGGGAAQPLTLDFGMVGRGLNCKYTITYTNNTGKEDTITKVTVENDASDNFTVTLEVPQTLADGASVPVAVTIAGNGFGEHKATVSIYTSNEAAPLVVVFTVAVGRSDVGCNPGPPLPGPGTPGGGRGRLK